MKRKVNPRWVLVIVSSLLLPLSVEAATSYSSVALNLYAVLHGVFAIIFLTNAAVSETGFFIEESEEVRSLKRENDCLISLIASDDNDLSEWLRSSRWKDSLSLHKRIRELEAELSVAKKKGLLKNGS